MSRFYLITGCSGGGKSTLLDALAARGHATVPEPGRRIVALARQGRAPFPWEDPTGFAHCALNMAHADLRAARRLRGAVFFDRGVFDAAVALDHAGAAAPDDSWPYARTVFVAPPWPALFARDADRRHSLADALAEYDRIRAALQRSGHRAALLPRASVAARVGFVLTRSIASARPAG